MKLSNNLLMCMFFILLFIRIWTTVNFDQGRDDGNVPDSINSVDECIKLEGDVSHCMKKFCERKKEDKTQCYAQMAAQFKKPTFCLLSENKFDCYADYTKRLSIDVECQKSGHLVEILSCFFEAVDLTKEQLEENSIAYCTAFYNALETSFAADKEDICVGAVGVYTKDAKLCDLAGNYKPECYRALALNSPKMTLADCDKAGTDYVGCYSTIAIRDSDVSVCSKLPEASKLQCIQQVAIKLKALSLCVQIGATSREGLQCAQSIVSQIKEDEYTFQFCEDLAKFGTGTGVRPDHCFYVVGLKTLNPQACERIVSDETEKNECQARVEHVLKNK